MIPSRVGLAVALALGVAAGSVIAQQPPEGKIPGTPPSLTPPAAGTGTGTGPADTQPPLQQERPIEWPKEIYGKTVQNFISEFSSSDPTVREIAVRTLPSFGPDARKVYMRPLLKLFLDPDPGVRINAILVAGSMPIEGKEELRFASDSLRTAIMQTSTGSAIRLYAAKTLSGMGPEVVHVLPTVMNLADDAWWETRQAAAIAVGRIGAPWYESPPTPPGGTPKAPVLKRPASKAAVEKLLNTFLNDKSSAVRLQAAQSLIALGPPTTTNPQEYIRAVKPWLDIVTDKLSSDSKSEKDPVVRVWLMVVSIMYDDRSTETNVGRITSQMVDGDSSMKIHALSAITMLGPKAKGAIPEVRKLLLDNDPSILLAAINAIVAQGEDAKYSIPDFEKALQQVKDPGLRDILRKGLSAVRQASEPKRAPEPAKGK